MWVSTTVLGVSQDHAQIAARALGDEAERMERALDAAIADPARSRERLLAIADAHEADWPQLRLCTAWATSCNKSRATRSPTRSRSSPGRIRLDASPPPARRLRRLAVPRRHGPPGHEPRGGAGSRAGVAGFLGPLVGARVEMIGSRGRGGEVVWDERDRSGATVDDVEVRYARSAEVEQAARDARDVFGLRESPSRAAMARVHTGS
jgi:hypothetical protein